MSHHGLASMMNSASVKETKPTAADASKIPDFTVNKPGTKATLVAEGKEIHVIKEVLSFHSSYFNTLLQSKNFKEWKSERIEIDHDYELLLQCMAIAPIPNGEIKLSYLHRLIESADFFDLAVVRNYCQSELFVRREDLVRVFILASHFGLTDAKDFLIGKIPENDVLKWLYGETDDEYGDDLEVVMSTEALRTLMKLAGSCVSELSNVEQKAPYRRERRRGGYGQGW